MAQIAVETVIGAPAWFVWEDLRDIGSHVEWMNDVRAINFDTDQVLGIGTTFNCDTRVGPFTVIDKMRVTKWVPSRVIGVDHQGLISGSGRFRLKPAGSATVFTWTESLHFPWYFGGPIAALAARPVLARIWASNLAALGDRIESAWLSRLQ